MAMCAFLLGGVKSFTYLPFQLPIDGKSLLLVGRSRQAYRS